MDDNSKSISLPDQLRPWWELIAAICAGLMAAGTAFGIENQAAKIHSNYGGRSFSNSMFSSMAPQGQIQSVAKAA